MPVELRKRKTAPPPPPPAKKATRAAKAAPKAASKVVSTPVAKTEAASSSSKKREPSASSTNGTTTAATRPAVGDTINLDGFGGEIETNDGKTTTLKALVDESKAGVAIFTYPRASTPGTKQACLFRDAHAALTSASGLAVYGLSADSPKANSAFRARQRLPYPLLCDPAATLIAAIGLAKTPRGTVRGVFVVDKAGRVLAAQGGGPAVTLDVVQAVVEGLVGGGGGGGGGGG
ncbi:AhpC-TSA-domain-containing protein [Trichocladium antarcticum]|uniref:thioredoxin-dependent peroxiredoxin n=1 Tax=Trichocladium antarcticum TaxID=1450529 RepID=A0AAN6ZIA5_9PEZI|nr:AhpC-TSA-domain-containing protein [Trichocladium antarcticum]